MADAGSNGAAKQQPVAKGNKQASGVAEKKEIKILMLHGELRLAEQACGPSLISSQATHRLDPFSAPRQAPCPR